MIHVLIPIEYTKLSYGSPHSRQLYQLDCGTDGTCDGLHLDLDDVDVGKPLAMLELGRVVGAEVISRTGNVSVIRWGEYRTFTVDLSAGTVSYSESGDSVEGRGQVTCEVSTVGAW